MMFSPISPLQGVPNFRDLGGLETADRRKIKPHKLLRGGHLAQLTPGDRQLLTETYDLKTVIDLRTGKERSQKPDQALPGVENIHCPIFESKEEGITRETVTEEDPVQTAIAMAKRMEGDSFNRMCGLYGVLLEEQGIAHYREFFRHLLAQEEGALLWHCTMGKDRCGTAAVFLETALGVPWETVVEDYLFSNVRIQPLTEQTIQAARAYTDDEALFEQMRILDAADLAFLNTMRDKAIALSGSLEDFLRIELDLTDEKREILKARYLE